MGLISTVNVFALVVVPNALLIRGYAIPWRLTAFCVLVGIALHIAALLFATAVHVRGFPLLDVVSAMLLPITHSGGLLFFLRNRRMAKSLDLSKATGHVALAVGMSIAHAILHCIGPLYQSANSPGFEGEVLFEAVRMNIELITMLLLIPIYARASIVGIATACVVMCVPPVVLWLLPDAASAVAAQCICAAAFGCAGIAQRYAKKQE